MDVSVIIRAKNEEEHLPNTLDMIMNQKTEATWEVVVVDSGSTDRTLEIASAYGCKIIQIPPEDFSFGYALNIGTRNSVGKKIVNLSAHAVPVNERWLDGLLAPFRVDSKVAAVYGRQEAMKGQDPLEELELRLWYPAHSADSTRTAGFSNANCAIRRDIWCKHPFDETLPLLEDGAWAKTVREQGYTIVYAPRSSVYHTHRLSVSNVYHRWYWRSYVMKLVSPASRGNSVAKMLVYFFGFCALDLLHLVASRQVSYIPRIPLYEALRQYARWRGAHDCNRNSTGARGERRPGFRQPLTPKVFTWLRPLLETGRG